MNDRVDDSELMSALQPLRNLEGLVIKHIKSESLYRIMNFYIVEGSLPKIEVGFTYEKVGLNNVTFSRPISELDKFLLI